MHIYIYWYYISLLPRFYFYFCSIIFLVLYLDCTELFLSEADLNPILASGIMPFLFKKTPNWVILIILVFILIVYINPYNIVLLVFNFITYKKIFIFYFFCNVIFGIYSILDWLIVILLLNNTINVSADMPKFIKSKLLKINSLSHTDKKILLAMHKQSLLLHFATACLMVIAILVL